MPGWPSCSSCSEGVGRRRQRARWPRSSGSPVLAEVMREPVIIPAAGPQRPSASARPPQGGRFAPARSGAGLSGLCGTGLSDALTHGRGNAVRFLIRPGPAEAIAEVMGDGGPIPAEGPKGPRPAPDPRSEGASRPPGQALASSGSRGTGHREAFPHGRGTCCAFSSAGPRPFRSSPTRPTTSRAPSSVRPPAQAATRRPKRRWHRRRPDTL